MALPFPKCVIEIIDVSNKDENVVEKYLFDRSDPTINMPIIKEFDVCTSSPLFMKLDVQVRESENVIPPRMA